MKYAVVIFTGFLSACGLFTTGDGSFTGRLVDVGWEGWIFKSCEVELQRGEQSSSMSKGSILDKQMCDALKARTGETITLQYQTWASPCCLRTDTRHEIVEVK